MCGFEGAWAAEASSWRQDDGPGAGFWQFRLGPGSSCEESCKTIETIHGHVAWYCSSCRSRFSLRCWHRHCTIQIGQTFCTFWSQIFPREDAEREEDFGKQILQFYCMPYSEFCIVCQEQKILVWLGRSTRRSWDVWLRFRAEALWDVFWFLIPISHKYWRYLYKWIYFTPQACWSVELGIETLVSLLDSSDSDDANHYPVLAWGRIAHFSSKEELKHSRKKKIICIPWMNMPNLIFLFSFPESRLMAGLLSMLIFLLQANSSMDWSSGKRTHQDYRFWWILFFTVLRL